MKETILLFHFNEERQKILTRSLLPLRIRIKAVKQEEMHLPVGYLAGVLTISQEQMMQSEKVQDVDSEMIVLAGVSGARLDEILAAIRRSGIGPVPYKAVLTETNQYWNADFLLAELKREHEMMHNR